MTFSQNSLEIDMYIEQDIWKNLSQKQLVFCAVFDGRRRLQLLPNVSLAPVASF